MREVFTGAGGKGTGFAAGPLAFLRVADVEDIPKACGHASCNAGGVTAVKAGVDATCRVHQSIPGSDHLVEGYFNLWTSSRHLPACLWAMPRKTGMSERPLAASPFVSIVVPCRNEADYVRPLLDSILANEYPHDRLEVLVVDGMSDDGTRPVIADYASRHPVIHLLDNPKRTTPCALNLGIRRARGEIIMRMDAHVYYPPNYIADLVHWLEQTGADNVGGACVTLPGNATVMARAIAVALAHPFGIGNARFRLGTTGLREVDTVPFGCFRREVFERVGLFDEDMVRNQDDEFNFRLLRAGGRVVLVPGVVSEYRARKSLGKLWRMFLQYGYFKPLGVRKAGAVMTGRQLVPPVFVSSLLLAAIFAPWLDAARLVLMLELAVYGAADLIVAAILARREGVFVGLTSSVVFPVLHLAYGAGYLLGVLDFLIRRRRSARAIPLSR